MTEYRSIGQVRKTLLASLLCLTVPALSAQAGGWWNHKSVVAVPTGPAVGTVQNAAPYQVFAAPAGYSAPQAYSAPAYSYAPAYSAPVYPQVTYGYSAAPVFTPAAAAPAAAAAYSAPAPNMNDLGRQLTEALKQVQNAQATAPAAQAAAPSTGQLSQDDINKLREILSRAAPAAAPAAATPNYSPVIIGYSYPQPAAAAPQATAPQTPAPQAPAGNTMQLVPVQLYRQKSFLGWDKLKPVNAYPYGVR